MTSLPVPPARVCLSFQAGREPTMQFVVALAAGVGDSPLAECRLGPACRLPSVSLCH